MNIAIIGPCFPWRGGIAHHTNQMINAYLNNGDRVGVFTFSRQYPHFLYPGKAQIEPDGTQNPLLLSPQIFIKKIIDTLNPFSWLKTASSIIHFNPDFCFIKYWHPYFVPCFTVIVWLLRLKGIKTICIVDNLFPHESNKCDSILARIFFKYIYAVVTQSEIVHEQFLLFSPNTPEIMVPHPVYDQFGPSVSMNLAREKLNIAQNKKVLLFFGFIRPYKGLDVLLSVMPKLIKKYSNIHLLIAGECFGRFNEYQEVINNLNLQSYISLFLGYIPNHDVPIYFCSCDLLVMPYKTITNSGIENIGKIYAARSLLTVGLNGDDLFQEIISIFEQKIEPKKIMKWSDYCISINNFISQLQ